MQGASAQRMRGFTMVEIMVVVFLIAITVYFVSLNLGRDVERLAKLEARRFQTLVNHIREESVVTGRLLAVQIDESENGYSFVEYNDGWKPASGDDTLRARSLGEGLKLSVLAVPDAPPDARDDFVVVDPVGTISPFSVSITGGEVTVTVQLDENLNVIIKDGNDT